MIADPPLLHDELAEAACPRGPSAVSAWRLGPGRAVPRLLDGPPKVRLITLLKGRLILEAGGTSWAPRTQRQVRGVLVRDETARTAKA